MFSKAEAAFRQAAEEVVRRARETGTPVVVWKDGRIEKILSEQVKFWYDGGHYPPREVGELAEGHSYPDNGTILVMSRAK